MVAVGSQPRLVVALTQDLDSDLRLAQRTADACAHEGFADFAEHCKGLGFKGFKIHGWHNGDVRREVANVLGVRERVGDDMYLMIDPACELRTFMDADSCSNSRENTEGSRNGK